MEDRTIISLIAILALAVLEAAALFNDINGQMFGIVIFIIGGIAGVSVDLISVIMGREKKDESVNGTNGPS